MFKKVPIETKEEILAKVKNGETVLQVANQYGISTKTIYAWLSNQVRPDISILEVNRLKRENDERKKNHWYSYSGTRKREKK